MNDEVRGATDDAIHAGQILDGAKAIAKYLVHLGFTMIGAEAGEVVAVVQTAMMADLPYTRLRDADFTHPTFSEGLNFLFWNAPPRSGK